jgi:hypothetical protein
MAGKECYYNSKKFTLVTTGGWQALLVLTAPANLPLFIKTIGLQPQGINNAAALVRFRLEKTSNVGTGGTSVSSSICVTNGRPETPLATILEGTFSIEPASASRPTMRGMAFHPQAPSDMPTLERGALVVDGGANVAIMYNNDSGEAVVCETEIAWEE